MCGPTSVLAFIVGRASERFTGAAWHGALTRGLVPVTLGLTAAQRCGDRQRRRLQLGRGGNHARHCVRRLVHARASALGFRRGGAVRSRRPGLIGGSSCVRAVLPAWWQRRLKFGVAMSDPTRLQAMAQWMWEARAHRLPYRNLPDDLRPASIAEAYAAQEAYYRMAEPTYGAVAGAKIATTTKVMQELMGIDHPCGGAVFRRTIHASPARLRAADFVNLRIESEIALQLGADLPASGAPWTRASVAPAVAAALPAFELIEDRNADYAKTEASSLIVENCWNGGIVIGTPKRVVLDLVGITGRLTLGGKLIGEGAAEGALRDANLARQPCRRARPRSQSRHGRDHRQPHSDGVDRSRPAGGVRGRWAGRRRDGCCLGKADRPHSSAHSRASGNPDISES
jgi:2-keto-4-pentenoate hydratase